MNKVLKKFYGKHKDTLPYNYTDLKGEPQEYDIQLNQLHKFILFEILKFFCEKNVHF